MSRPSRKELQITPVQWRGCGGKQDGGEGEGASQRTPSPGCDTYRIQTVADTDPRAV